MNSPTLSFECRRARRTDAPEILALRKLLALPGAHSPLHQCGREIERKLYFVAATTTAIIAIAECVPPSFAAESSAIASFLEPATMRIHAAPHEHCHFVIATLLRHVADDIDSAEYR